MGRGFGEETPMRIRLSGRSRAKGGLVTLGTVVGLISAMAITLFGTGAADNAIASFDASSWLWSSNKGEVARVNGVTGRVDTRQKITDAQGHTLQVSQNDRYVILRDLNTGKVSVLDLASLQIGASTQTTPGVGVTVALHDDLAFVIDSVQGLVRQLDPATLNPVGQPLSFPPGLVGGTFDESGRLWVLVPSEGTAIAIKPIPVGSGRVGGGQGGGGQGGDASATPSVFKNVAVADPSHDLALTILDNGVAVLDKTSPRLTTLRGDALKTVTLPLTGPGAMPTRTVGGDVPVTVVDDRHVYVVTGDRVVEFAVPGASPKLQPCVAWSGRLYCADDTSGSVYVLDAKGQLTNTFQIPNGGKGLELEVREDRLFINAPDASTARVVDEKHKVKSVDKYANNVVGGDPPPVPPAPPPPKPVVGPPGAPTKVTAVAGNASARVTWGPAPANGAAIMKYVVEGGGAAREVSAGTRSVEIPGLTNGQEYRFSVHAVNAKGAGPKRTANPVIPTAEVPDPPASIAATANPDGTVAVTWPAANGQGRKIVRYAVTPVVAGGAGEVRETDATTLSVKAGNAATDDVKYGAQVAFRVVAVNEKGASSAPSPLSNSVVPFNRPDPPRGLTAVTTTSQRGGITVNWAVPEDNGSPITGYKVTANDQTQTVTGTAVTLTGFADGATVKVAVKATNKAGDGKAAEATASTLRAPTITLGSPTGATNSITVPFTANAGGGTPARCVLAVTGGPTVQNACQAGAALTAGGLWPGNTYAFSVTITNSAGMTAAATGSAATPALFGATICSTPSYCGPNADNGGIWVYPRPTQSGTAVGDTFNGQRFQATCKATGDRSIDASPHGGKTSNMWVRIKFPGAQDNYIPFAWFRLDNGDNLGQLPTC